MVFVRLNEEVYSAHLHAHIHQIQHMYHSTPISNNTERTRKTSGHVLRMGLREDEISSIRESPLYHRSLSDRTRSKSSQRRMVHQNGVHADHRKSSSQLMMAVNNEELPEEHREALDILQKQLEAPMEVCSVL